MAGIAGVPDGGLDWSQGSGTEQPMKRATYEDVLNAPENKVAEILDGELFVSPRPAPRHSVAHSRLMRAVGGPFDDGIGGPGGWWILTEPELHLGEHVVVPDLGGWRRERMPAMPDEAFFRSPPTGSARCCLLPPSGSTAGASSASTPRPASLTRGSSSPPTARSRCSASATARGRMVGVCEDAARRAGRAVRGARARARPAVGGQRPAGARRRLRPGPATVRGRSRAPAPGGGRAARAGDRRKSRAVRSHGCTPSAARPRSPARGGAGRRRP